MFFTQVTLWHLHGDLFNSQSPCHVFQFLWFSFSVSVPCGDARFCQLSVTVSVSCRISQLSTSHTVRAFSVSNETWCRNTSCNFYITMHFPKHHQGTCGKFHQWGASISVALLKWIYSNSVTTWVSFTNNQFHSRFSVISVSLHLTGLMSDSVALTLLPDSLAGIASGLKRKSQQILYFLSLGSAKNLLPVVMWWFYLRSLKQLAKVYWDFFLKGGKLSLSSPKALWILAEKLRWFVQTLTSFLNFWKPSSCDACFRQLNPWMGLRKERLQSGKVRDPDAWLHWTYIREVAEPSSNSGVGHQAETDRNLEQFLVKKFCLFF